nr:SCO-spondin-like isoform X1 [Lepeophtheirus salmonis]
MIFLSTLLIIGILITPSKSTGRITPLLKVNSTACIAENLRLTDRYICDSYGNIICVGGWSNPTTLCNVPVCDMNGQGCLNGECLYPNVCACEVGWDGPNCDECIPLGGCRHGSCQKPMECNCKPGWTGGRCSKPQCEGCVNGCCHEPNKCICDFGWKGHNCTECQTLSNCKHGKCLTHPFQCECFDGWQGLDCSKPICRVGCHPTYGFCKSPGECICKNGWSGRDCTDCVPYPGCNGTCVNSKPWTCTDINTNGMAKPDIWSQWSQWSSCSKTCGDGTQRRDRTCLDRNGVSGNCVGKSDETRTCSVLACKIDGGWSIWTKWTPCSSTCGTGTKSRFRSCSNPIPKYGGKICVGSASESAKCFSRYCPVEGRWSSWKSWGGCSVTCGEGTRHRNRYCDSPSPAHGGPSCFGPPVESTKCIEKECPIDGIWLSWTQWTTCSKTCGPGTQERTRTCDGPQFGGQSCSGNFTIERDVIPCWQIVVCPTDGEWSEWDTWSPCSKTCESGSRFRQRHCNNPAPKFGGKTCRGSALENGVCNADVNCPINGKWNSWGRWSICSVSCGGGIQGRRRTCTVPQFGGEPCNGQSDQERQCNQIPCPVVIELTLDGVWSLWSKWSSCSKTCEGGFRQRIRECISPQLGSELCSGSSREIESCNDKISCTTDTSNWNTWSNWSSCSASCGHGLRVRSRACPTKGSCEGNSFEEGKCQIKPCVTDGNWGYWQEWTSCSVSCGKGQKTRGRFCNNPSPSDGGKPCSGYGLEKSYCIQEECTTGGSWGQWGTWSACTLTCGNSVRTRARTCHNSSCEGEGIQTERCSVPKCPIDGGFSQWFIWSQCTADCKGDRGNQSRRRFCNNPVPLHGGKGCAGEIKQKRYCTGNLHKQETNPDAPCFHIGNR